LQKISNSAKYTQEFAKKFAKKLARENGQVLALAGDLGSGKTCFVQGLARGLGIKKPITSPTFILIKEYRVSSKHLAAKNLIHIDLYRLRGVDPVFEKELQEYFTPENLVVIEWPEKIKHILPSNTKWFNFEYLDENRRKIVLSEENYDFGN